MSAIIPFNLEAFQKTLRFNAATGHWIPSNPCVVSPGQSNDQGFNPDEATNHEMALSVPPGIPSNLVRFFCSDNLGEDLKPRAMSLTDWGDPNQAHHGPELQCSLDLLAAGWGDLTWLKWTHNGQFITNFAPGGPDWYRLHRVITGGRPNKNPTLFYYLDQGEAEAKDTTDTRALNWSNDFQIHFDATQAMCGAQFVGGKIMARIRNDMPGGTYANIVRACQMSIADKWFDTDSLAVYSVDHLHYTGLAQNVLGSMLAAYYIALVDSLAPGNSPIWMP